MRAAVDAREFAYAPYSDFRVGAALLCKNGKVYTGCNIENASYSPTNCAERTAFFKAVSEGERDFRAIAIVGNMKDAVPDIKEFVSPCGVCRQVMAEFCNPGEFKIILANRPDNYRVYTLMELLPLGFSLDTQ
jgi:cytidine deaminase